jgi:hypothetical protein
MTKQKVAGMVVNIQDNNMTAELAEVNKRKFSSGGMRNRLGKV